MPPDWRGKKNPKYNGGKCIRKDGYIWLYLPDHPDAAVRGMILEHRVVMEKTLGRRLTRNEVVHHLNGNPSNNHPGNLALLDGQSAHVKMHPDFHVRRIAAQKARGWVITKCGICGKTFSAKRSLNKITCDRRCGALWRWSHRDQKAVRFPRRYLP